MGCQIFLSVVSSMSGDTWIYEYPSVTVLQTICRSLLSKDFSVTDLPKIYAGDFRVPVLKTVY